MGIQLQGHSTPTFRPMPYGQTAGWIKMLLGTEVDLGPGHIVLDGDPAPPSPERGTLAPLFLAHVYCGQTVLVLFHHYFVCMFIVSCGILSYRFWALVLCLYFCAHVLRFVVKKALTCSRRKTNNVAWSSTTETVKIFDYHEFKESGPEWLWQLPTTGSSNMAAQTGTTYIKKLYFWNYDR